MKLFSDYHTHPQGHRVQRYNQESLLLWVEQARKNGLTDIAFTDHDRYCEGIDFDEIEKLRGANPDIKIRAGIELDNDPVYGSAGRFWIEKNWERLDFVLGSIHFLERPDQMFDSVPAGAGQFAGRDVDEIYADYFRRVREIAASGLVDCLAHLDLIKIHGHRSNSGIEAIAGETLDFVAARGLAIELSTAGWRKPVNEMYPSDEIIRLAIARGIPFTTASDAHSHVQLGENYERLEEKMEKIGIRQVSIFERHHAERRAL
ncbi:MAG TPA: histidinol-phosphatase HisJ family protein [Chthoniobacterales bacterium]|jgi:histidinol-phosphatase (PHP family)